MKWIYLLFPLSSLLAQSALTNDALFSLQQLRTVVPERLWEQEFSILVKTQTLALPSRDYFLFSTMSGEPIRILDRYQEFEEGVFWDTPGLNDQLQEMEDSSKSEAGQVVEQPKLGKITVRGNCYFPTSWFSDAMRSQLGEPIDAKRVLEDVAWLNLNPFRRTDAIYTQGDKPGFVDLELVAIDRWPYRVYAGADNTGTEATNRNRIFFGFNFGKSALKDGQISYQFTCAPNWNLYYSHTASARLPLPWRHEWVLWGGYASVKPDTHIVHTKNEGISWQVDTRYRIPCFLSTQWLQTFVLGYDFKETNNEIHVDRVEISDTDADINQFMLGYELGYRSRSRRATLNAEIYFNPGGITYANKTQFYEQLQAGAKSQYAYLRLNHGFAQQFSLGWFTYDVTAQWASANLLPSEQLTLTGYNAVRGYEERILNLDNALILNVACETPHWNPAHRWKFSKNKDELYFLAFFDYGLGSHHHTPSGEDSFKNLASIGPGVRWQYDRYFTARFDYGFQLWHSGFHNPTHSRYNFGLILSY